MSVHTIKRCTMRERTSLIPLLRAYIISDTFNGNRKSAVTPANDPAEAMERGPRKRSEIKTNTNALHTVFYPLFSHSFRASVSYGWQLITLRAYVSKFTHRKPEKINMGMNVPLHAYPLIIINTFIFFASVVMCAHFGHSFTLHKTIISQAGQSEGD